MALALRYRSAFREVMLRVKVIEPLLPRRGTDDDTNLGRLRWVVEHNIGELRRILARPVATAASTMAPRRCASRVPRWVFSSPLSSPAS